MVPVSFVVRVPLLPRLPATCIMLAPVDTSCAWPAIPANVIDPDEFTFIVPVFTVTTEFHPAVAAPVMAMLLAVSVPSPTFTVEVAVAVGAIRVTAPFTVRVTPELITREFEDAAAARDTAATVASAVTVIVTPEFIVMVSVEAGIPPRPVQPLHLVPSFQSPVAAALHAAA